MPQADVAIAGGGLAGGIAAVHLARAGRQVVLFERKRTAHDKVCGAFLSDIGASELERIGLPLTRGRGYPLRSLLTFGGKPQNPIGLPFSAWSISRHELDEEILELAAKAGAEVRRGDRVTEAAPNEIALSSGERLSADRVISAIGKLDFPRSARTGSHRLMGLK
ncbi:MAG: FAD-dependent monooxygenase, partial [Parvularcula sp.]|nr:FAD-dependent monooxygenase [Parvularcula sp.]